ncbi:MAG: DUF2779 domain-containing protein [Gemmatimonadota bacterium]|nr:DUF2779 domain-containing protein [Gemmatimonadota bacterium]MDH3367229.1 DUF2779 domain-containing protein [Gemmatimonadota bacterium]MDH3478132.1 DUF2779 domain-containing protein [Gemmatimonadota bacterium]MDH3569964.1 DUF2779 domain-containing protein [Gemmatimonadota bacterium]MDH5550491.1 DUF2779 domain-containing protein [Gemmatimonadota bacterium]
MPHQLTKSRFMDGWHCPNLLWWRVHEPASEELDVSPALKFRFAQGHAVDIAARKQVPGGVAIDYPHDRANERLRATKHALAMNVPAIYGATFLANHVYVVVDILERAPDGYHLIEVKSTTSVKAEHVPDVAIQTYVARASGIKVRRSELMHLNRACRYPDLSNLFVREDLTEHVEEMVPILAEEVIAQLETLEGPYPALAIGEQCYEMTDCPFFDRCWPDRSGHHVTTLYRLGLERAHELMRQGYGQIEDLPLDVKLPKLAHRQRRAVHEGSTIVGPKLAEALEPFTGPIAFLDFETVSLAIPVWDGCTPWQQVPAQFSCHVEDGRGGYIHHAWLADTADDPREPIANALIEACVDATSIVAYYASFEKGCLDTLIAALPHRAADLESIKARLVDLYPVVRDHVYHPDFYGSFSLKTVIPALVPELDYDDLGIAEGELASTEIARMLFKPETLSPAERETLRDDLLAYCARDTEVMVALLERLRGMETAE